MPRITTIEDDEVPDDVLQAVRGFVLDAFDGDFTDDDWDHARGGWRVIAFDGEDPVSHAAVVPRRIMAGDRWFRTGYVEAVATRRERQRAGLASVVMRAATQVVRDHFELGALSTPIPEFYERFGWERWRGPSFVLEGPRRVRTASDDDGLMVLRFGPSAGVELGAPIACESRPGDDW